MVTNSQWYVIPLLRSTFDLCVKRVRSPLGLGLASYWDSPLLAHQSQRGQGKERRRKKKAHLIVAAHVHSSMSHDSSLSSLEARGAFKSERYDDSDANIRNFAPVARIMKNALPDNAKIAKEAKECMQECVSEFISFITSEGLFSDHPLLRLNVRLEKIPSKLVADWLPCSFREVSPREAEDGEWRGHIVCHDVARV
jgi:hypothetical protein